MNHLDRRTLAGISRRTVLRTGSAVAAGALAMPWVRRVSAADQPTVVNSIRSLTNPYHATWNKGGEAFAKSVGARLRHARDRGQQREGRRRHQGDAGQDRRQHGPQRRPERQPGRAPDRRGLPEGRRLRRHPVEQARRPAPLGPRPELRRPHLVQRRPERQGDGRGAVQGHGRQGRDRGAGRHPVERAGHRAQEGPRHGAEGATRTSSSSTSRSRTGSRPRRSTRPTPGSPSSATRSAASGPPTTTWRSAAIEALRADGRAGKVPVTGIDGIQLAVEAILAGEMAGTVSWDPFWQGGMGLSLGYHAKTGKFDPTQGAEGTPRVLRHAASSSPPTTPRNSTRTTSRRAQARLERHLGPRDRPDPVQLSGSADRPLAGRC